MIDGTLAGNGVELNYAEKLSPKWGSSDEMSAYQERTLLLLMILKMMKVKLMKMRMIRMMMRRKMRMMMTRIMMMMMSTCRMVGFFEKVGAVPSTCGWGGASTAAKTFDNFFKNIFNF